jgi:hypothetical protein
MGVSPKHWGREGWKFIHWVALTYPNKPTEKDKKNYRNYLETLATFNFVVSPPGNSICFHD